VRLDNQVLHLVAADAADGWPHRPARGVAQVDGILMRSQHFVGPILSSTLSILKSRS
jgi:hypothetical protein